MIPRWWPQHYLEVTIATSVWHTTITADSTAHVKGAWVELVDDAQFDFDVQFVEVMMSENFINSTDTSTLLDIGYDPAGGSTYGVVIPDILAGGTGDIDSRPRRFTTPVYIPKGSSIAARSQAIITSDLIDIGIALYGGVPGLDPFPNRGPIVAYGVTSASASSGIVMLDSSANTKSAWKEIVSATTHPHRGLFMGIQPAVASLSEVGNLLYDIGIGAGGSEVLLAENFAFFRSHSNEIVHNHFPHNASPVMLERPVPEGSRLSMRSQSDDSNAGADWEVALYGWG